jgi:hypothetical protein
LSYHSAFVPLLNRSLAGIHRGTGSTAPTFHDGVVISQWLDIAPAAARTASWS